MRCNLLSSEMYLCLTLTVGLMLSIHQQEVSAQNVKTGGNMIGDGQAENMTGTKW
jgi:hypothetical protein